MPTIILVVAANDARPKNPVDAVKALLPLIELLASQVARETRDVPVAANDNDPPSADVPDGKDL